MPLDRMTIVQAIVGENTGKEQGEGKGERGRKVGKERER